MKTTHTPGPWEIDCTDWPIIINGPDDADGANVVAIVESSAQAGNQTYRYSAETAMENAALIASAPGLLAERDRLREQVADLAQALDNLLALHLGEIGGDEFVAQARAELAKVSKTSAPPAE